jgi:hypothetical protein
MISPGDYEVVYRSGCWKLVSPDGSSCNFETKQEAVTPSAYAGAMVSSLVTLGRMDGAVALVNEHQVRGVASLLEERFRAGTPAPAAWDDPLYWNVDASPDNRCQYLAVGNAINFRFWSLVGGRLVPSQGVVGGQRERGSMFMWRRLLMATQSGDLSLNAEWLAQLRYDQMRRAFIDDEGNLPLVPALADRVANLRDLGKRLIEHWDGQFKNVVDAAAGSLERFASLSSEFRAFDDPVQKLTMVNAIMLSGSGLAAFDRDPLPGIDYHLVKQALRQGLVLPPPELALKLVERKPLTPDESLVLRRAVMLALTEVARYSGIPTTVLDNLYWLNRRVCSEENWACHECPFNAVCTKQTVYGSPLEATRYY